MQRDRLGQLASVAHVLEQKSPRSTKVERPAASLADGTPEYRRVELHLHPHLSPRGRSDHWVRHEVGRHPHVVVAVAVARYRAYRLARRDSAAGSEVCPGVADTVATTGITVDTLLDRVDSAALAHAIGPALDDAAPELARRVMDAVKPGLFDSMAPPAQTMVVQQLQTEGRRIATVTVDALKPVLRELLDLRNIVVKRLSGSDSERLARLFRRVGRRELEVVIWYGAVLGFVIGLLEVGVWELIEKWWLLPLVGAIDGLVNNWLAIQMIFRPQEKKKYFGFIPWQGLFPARQDEISREYGQMLAAEVLAPKEILADFDQHAQKRLFDAATAAIESATEPLIPMLAMLSGTFPGPAEKARALEAVSGLISERLDVVRPYVEAHLAEKLVIAETLEVELARMPKSQFERVLRGVFEADEWILVSLGGVLGGLIGLLQAGIVVYFS